MLSFKCWLTFAGIDRSKPRSFPISLKLWFETKIGKENEHGKLWFYTRCCESDALKSAERPVMEQEPYVPSPQGVPIY